MAIPASVSEFLDRHHAQYSLISHPAAYTAQEEAAAAHVPGREWAKVVVCVADDHPLMAVLPAPCKVDFDRLKSATNAQALRLANENECKQLFADCEVGAMPPFGPLYQQDVFVDEALATGSDIVFDGGSHRESIRMPFAEFTRVVRPTVADFALGSRRLRNRVATTRTADPVCGATLREQSAWGWSDHQGHRYFFCSQVCKMEFDDNPAGYASAGH